MLDKRQGMNWKLRRIAARLRQQDVASLIGVSTTRYSALERGEEQPSRLDLELIERALPPLPGPVLAKIPDRGRTR